MSNKIKGGGMHAKRVTGDIITYIFLIVLSVIWLIPFFWLVMQSFRDGKGQFISTFLPKAYTVNNYKALFTQFDVMNFPRMFMNTFFIACCTCVISTFFVLSVAYCTSRLKWKMRKPYMNMAMILNLFPGFMTMIAVYFILKALGMTEGNRIPLALIICFSSGSGTGFFVMKGFMDTIPKALDEAATLDGCTRWLADEGEAAFAAWRTRLDAFDAAVRDLKNTKILCCGADALTAHSDFFAHDSGKILLQIGAAGAAYLRADGFEPEMVCGPNVLAMTSPCDDADALERLADVLHAWDKTAAPPAAPRHILPAPGAARCTIAEALLRPARAVRMRDAVGETAAEYLWAYPPGVPLVAPGEEVTAELVTACRALEQAGTALKHTGGSGAEGIAVLL